MQQLLRNADRRRWVTLIIVCFAMLMNVLDQTIVNVALPAIQHDLRFDQANLAWVVDAYLVAFGGSLLLAGRLGDIMGRKKVFLGGVTLFTLASMICGLSDSQTMMIAARFVQGLGAALSSSVILAIIVAEFTDPEARTKATSAYIMVAVGGGAVGLLVGGALTEFLNWHWDFFINLPIGLLTLAAGAWLVQDNDGLGFEHGIDVAGSVLATAGLMIGIYAIVTSGEAGWASPRTLARAGVGLALLGSFLYLQGRLANPIMPLRILRARGLLSSSAVRGLVVVGMYATFFLGALSLEHVHGYDTLHTGLAFMPQVLSVLFLSMGITARLMLRFGAKRTALMGLSVIFAGLLVMIQATAVSSYFPLQFAGFLLVGLGAGTLFTPLVTIAIADVPVHDAGLASGIVNVSQNVSAAIGVAILGTISTAYTQLQRASGSAALPALSAGYQAGFVVAAASVALGLVLALVLIRSETIPASTEAGAEELAIAA